MNIRTLRLATWLRLPRHSAARIAQPCRDAGVPAVFGTLALWLCALLFAFAAAQPAAAQTIITVDPATAVEASGSSVAMNHTVGTGTDRYLIVSVAIERNDAVVNSVTYAGQALTFLGRITDAGAGATLDVWGRVAPASGTNQVLVNLNSGAAVVVGAISFANVNQTSPIAASQFASGTSGTLASASVASATDQLVLAVIAANDEVNSVTAGSGQTSRWNVLNAADVIGAASTRTGLAGSTTMSYTLGAQGRRALGLFALRPVNPLIVTNTNDSGGGSLRNAITFANSNAGADTISFAIPGAGPHTITLSSALPDLTDNGTVIDGTTQSGTQCRDLWAGSAHDLRVNVRGNSGFDGFRLSGTSQAIRGLSLTGFQNAIVALASSSSATIQCNYLGLLPDGTSSGNTRGVAARGASALVGGLDPGQGNVISANSIVGVLTENGSTDTAIRGNFIGTDPAGLTARANGGGGINNFFGTATWRDITYNLISGNTGTGGIVLESDDQISPSTDTIRIQRNVIGLSRDSSALVRNSGDGIGFAAGSITNVLIGGIVANSGNQIASLDHGIDIRSASNVTIQGNTIALSVRTGIWLDNVSNATIGGVAGLTGNFIGGNGNDGININNNSSNITINGNFIQTISTNLGTFSNGGNGIAINNATGINIGNGTNVGRNVIGGNRRRAIFGTTAASSVTINGNYIGTDSTGNNAVTNGQIEGPSRRDAIIFEIGTFSNISILNNVIGGYTNAQIRFSEGSVDGLLVRGNNIGVGADGVTQIVSANTESLIAFGGGTRNYSNVTIGGLNPGEGNIVAHGGQNGITVNSAQTGIAIIGNTLRNNTGNGILIIQPTQAAILGNRILNNGLLGIDLGADGVTPNDAGDGDGGANDQLNFPSIGSVNVAGPNELRYNFTLDAPAAANGYRIEFFASSAADPTGFGEGERFLGAVDITHAGGAQSYTGTLTTLEPVSIGDVISATTTRRTAGGAWDITSEFSATATADGVAQLAVAITSDVFDPPAGNPFATPGNDVLLTTTITNGGTGSTDADTVFAVITISPDTSFYNAATPALGGVVGFSSGAPSLTFDPATDLRFSNGSSAPQSLAECTYTPTAGYDPQVRYVCLNPKGTMPSGGAQGQAQVQMRLRIN